jgi:hypothetical protein
MDFAPFVLLQMHAQQGFLLDLKTLIAMEIFVSHMGGSVMAATKISNAFLEMLFEFDSWYEIIVLVFHKCVNQCKCKSM